MSDTFYTVPRFFRVLIIDDEVARDHNNIEYRDFFTSYFVYEIYKASGHSIPQDNIEVKFTQNPETGIKLWAQEVFDLTLIDCNFEHWSKVSRRDKTDYLWLNAKRQGVVVLRQLRDWMNGDSARFAYRKCKNAHGPFWLWTGEKIEDAKKYLASYDLENDKYFLSKTESVSTLQEYITDHCSKIINDRLPIAQQIERFIYAIRMSNSKVPIELSKRGMAVSRRLRALQESPFTPQLNPMGGIILRVDKNIRALCLPDPEESNYRYAVFPKHPPELKENMRFIPLVGSIVAPHASDDGMQLSSLVQYLIHEEPIKEITSMCNQYRARQCETQPQEIKSLESLDKTETMPTILEHKFPSRYFAAATPLTGISVIGSDHAQDALANKVVRQLNESFGGVILKTAYLDSLDQWKDANWPGIQVQSHMRSRALYPLMTSTTLWNTGRTAMETFTPKLLNMFLNKLKDRLPGQSHRVVVSLGSKFCYDCQPFMEFSSTLELRNLWVTLFKTVFYGLNSEYYPLVEINVRHYLREIVKKHIGGDEYLSPVKLNEIGQAHPNDFWAEYGEWLNSIHTVAVQYKKKLILKFPYRSDSLGLIRSAVAVRRLHFNNRNKHSDKDYGIRGITVGNALKTPVPKTDRDSSINYSQSWYADPQAWGDAADKKWKYQMSGSQLASYRNQILPGILQPDVLAKLKDLDIALFISGGITSKEDIEFIEQHLSLKDNNAKLDYGIQIATWSLLSAGPKIGDKKDWKKATKPLSPGQGNNVVFALDDCAGICCAGEKLTQACGNVKKSGEDKACLINPTICIECDDRVCLRACGSKKLSLKASADNNALQPAKKLSFKAPADNNFASQDVRRTKEIRIAPRICFLSPEKCAGCGLCLQTFYCDAFSHRKDNQLPPLHDPRQCTGCALCAQICPSGALKLYRPEEKIAVLISSSVERKEVLRELGIPCLSYNPVDDLINISVGDSNAMAHCKSVIDLVTEVTRGTPDKVDELKSKLESWIDTTWEERLKEKFVLGEGKREYKDLRSDRRKECIKSAKHLVEQCDAAQYERLTAIVRAILWSQLIWSDPGQIFWDTPIVVIQSCLLKKATDNEPEPIRSWQETPYSLPQGEYIIGNFAVTGQQGQLALKESTSEVFTFSGFPPWYVANKLGKGRLANLDIRSYGDYLLSNYKKDDINALSGIPDLKLFEGKHEIG